MTGEVAKACLHCKLKENAVATDWLGHPPFYFSGWSFACCSRYALWLVSEIHLRGVICQNRDWNDIEKYIILSLSERMTELNAKMVTLAITEQRFPLKQGRGMDFCVPFAGQLHILSGSLMCEIFCTLANFISCEHLELIFVTG